MPEFLTLLPPGAALQHWLAAFDAQPIPEEISTSQALGRVTASAVIAPHRLPTFNRSTVDGYAVRAADTYGAGESLPAYLQVLGEVPMGAQPEFKLEKGGCALIHTGGMLPDGADAVVMVENTQIVGDPQSGLGGFARSGQIEVLRAAAVAENVLKAGEDVAEGQEVIPAGTRLRPAEIGGLMALGLLKVTVSRKPGVAILSTGDEVVAPEALLLPGQVRDVNTYSLSALVEGSGGRALSRGIVSDRPDELRAAARKALEEADCLVITAGSSASSRDLTAEVIGELGEPGVLVHGVDVRPGKPTILAVCDGKPVIGLPGNPVSALVIAGLFVVPVIAALLGLRQDTPRPSVTARLALNLPSQAGREDWVPVRLVPSPQGYRAEPVFGKSNLIFTLARAAGMVRIPPDATGLEAGAEVEVLLF